MRIKINADEVYELEVPKEIDTLENFYALLKKLDNVTKLIKINLMTGTTYDKFKNKFQQMETNKATRKYNINPNLRKNKNPFLDTKEKVLDVLQYAYHGDKEDKNRISKIMGYSWTDICKRFHALLKRYEVKPNEIGLTNLPSERYRGLNLRIPNYIIKSHTGVFDENGTDN